MNTGKEWHTNVMEILDAHAQLVIREIPRASGGEEKKATSPNLNSAILPPDVKRVV